MQECMNLLSLLRLSGIKETLEQRLEQAKESNWSAQELLLMVLQDEQQYRQSKGLAKRLQSAHFEEEKTLEALEYQRYDEKSQRLIRDLKFGHYLKKHEHVIILGPTGTGKTHLAQALGHEACRQGKQVRFIKASKMFRLFKASRADHTWEKWLNKFSKYDLLIIDDFGLSPMDAMQTEDLYELIAQRCLTHSTIVTSNRKIEAWVELFCDPVMANAALDRLSNGAHHLLLEGSSYRCKKRPKIISEG